MRPSPPTSQERLPPLVFLALALVLCSPALWGWVPTRVDLTDWIQPVQAYVARSVWSGQIPFWDNCLYCGHPLLGNIEVGLFYPPNWLNLVFGPYPGMTLSLGFHLWLVAYGSYRYARCLGYGATAALAAGVQAEVGGSLWGLLYDLAHFGTFAWFPWLLVWTHQRRWLRLAGGITLQCLAGSPQMALLSGLSLVALNPGQLWRIAASAGLGLAGAALQLLPFLELSLRSPRQGLGSEFAWFGLGGWSWQQTLPELSRATPELYVSLLTWVGLTFGLRRHNLRLLGLAAGGAILSVHGLPFLLHLPLYSSLRFPKRWLVVTVWSLGMVAARSLDLCKPRLASGLLLLYAADSLWLGASQTPFGPEPRPTEAYLQTETGSSFPARTGFFPFVPPRDQNRGLATGLQTITGYSGAALRDYLDFLAWATRGRSLTDNERKLIAWDANMFPWHNLHPNFASLMQLKSLAWTDIHEQQTFVQPGPAGLGRFFLVGRTVQVGSPVEAFQLLRGEDFHPDKTLILEQSGPASGEMTGSVRLLRYSSDRIELETNASAPGWCVVCETDYPGWEGSLDQIPVQVWRAYGIFRAVPVPAGVHHLTLVYRPRSFRLGLLVSSLALFIGLLCKRPVQPRREKVG